MTRLGKLPTKAMRVRTDANQKEYPQQTGHKPNGGFPVMRALLVNLKARGLRYDPLLAIGDGALGFWKALEKVFPTTRVQRCTVHKTANVLDKMPKSVQPQAKIMLHSIWDALEERRSSQSV
jgi:transposase-like protein